uniref:3-ketodihydrosphingosine reductase n=1 Tax=Saccharum hybrid cultivar R570 TaxID=131158 RepID=A0A059Q328_9POAL|nr:3-ketodihydrosphingosine reductase [Saccharum hybrid cultivar R570]
MDPPSSSSLGHLEVASVRVPPVGLLAALAFLSWPRAVRIPLKGRHVFIGREARAAIQRDSGHDDVVVHAADVRDARAVVRALREAGPVNVLVYNHGMFISQELERQDMDEIKWMVDINLRGTFHLIKAVGIYGYTAYSASKFALRGLGEALQHEVVADNIHVSLIFPPDTETLGFKEEHKRRPELTNIMAGGMKADDVAKKALDGI